VKPNGIYHWYKPNGKNYAVYNFEFKR